MSDKNLSYYQFHKDLGYQIYLQFEDFDFESELSEVVEMLGFEKVEREQVQSKSFDKLETKVLKINRATPRVAREINREDYILDKYGDESISSKGSYEIYRFKSIGMMIFSEGSNLWELGVNFDESKRDGLRCMLTRFLSLAFANTGVVGFWGLALEDGFVVTRAVKANYESIFIDLKKNILLSYDGMKKIDYDLRILRLDDAIFGDARKMPQEALLSFLSTHTCFMSYQGLAPAIKETLYGLCQKASGYYYPEHSFQPKIAANLPLD